MNPLHTFPKQTQTQVLSSVLCPPTSVFRRLPRRRLGSRLLTPVSELRTPNYELFCPQTYVYLFVQLFQSFGSILYKFCILICNFLESFADFCCLLPISPKNPITIPKPPRPAGLSCLQLGYCFTCMPVAYLLYVSSSRPPAARPKPPTFPF